MANRCDICGKGPRTGNHVSHAKNRRRRTFQPNLQRIRAIVDGTPRRLRVCSSCLRSGRVKKAAT
ncbi:MAG: 50S ribosomal protein L28 [Acidobacteriota bacterium]